MTLKEYLKESKVDTIEDDSEFCEKEYELAHEYFDENGFTDKDMEEFYKRGFDNDTLNCWKDK